MDMIFNRAASDWRRRLRLAVGGAIFTLGSSALLGPLLTGLL